MGEAECIALALEEECDDLVGVVGGGYGLERDGGFMVLASCVHEPIPAFRKCCTHLAKCTILQIL
jgi:hypothetical protein